MIIVGGLFLPFFLSPIRHVISRSSYLSVTALMKTMAVLTLRSTISTFMLLALTPAATSLRPTPSSNLSPSITSTSPLSTLALSRRGWATASALGLTAAVGLPRSAAAFTKEAEKGALTSLERQVELKRRPLPLLTRKKLEQVS